MATEYKLSYTASEINTRLGKIDSLAEKSEVPTKTSQLTNDSGFLTAVPIEYVTETELNAKGYLTQHQSLADYAKTADLGDLATKDTVAKTDLASDVQTSLGKADSALQSYTETDPTVPSWAKAANKPSYSKSEVGLGNVDNVKQYSASNPPPYPVTKVNGKTGAVSLTASDVGADASGTANSAISTHNSNTSAHADIRQEISALSSEIADIQIEIPVRGTHYWTEADQEDIVQQVITALGTPVFGRVDEDNNIILTGELAEGVYTLKYEDADGNVTEIGTLNHSNIILGDIPITWVRNIKLDKTTGVGSAQADGTYCTCEPIELDENGTYAVTVTNWFNNDLGVNYCYYDADGKYVGYVEGTKKTPETLTPPAGARKLKLRVWVGSGNNVQNTYLAVISIARTA